MLKLTQSPVRPSMQFASPARGYTQATDDGRRRQRWSYAEQLGRKDTASWLPSRDERRLIGDLLRDIQGAKVALPGQDLGALRRRLGERLRQIDGELPREQAFSDRPGVEALITEVERLGRGKVQARFHEEKLFATVEGRTVAIDGLCTRNLIDVSLSSGLQNARLTARHETFHALKNLGLLDPKEWRLLEKRAETDWRARFDIDRRYSAYSNDERNEEAAAAAFEEWDRRGMVVGDQVKASFTKVKGFFERTGNALRGMGFQTADDVMNRIESGDVALREPYRPKPEKVAALREAVRSVAYRIAPDWLRSDGSEKDLMVLHNTDQTKLQWTLDLGSFPAPSLAVVRKDLPFSNFGSITLIGSADIIDPAKDPVRHNVFEADAYTPRVPMAQIRRDPEAVRRLDAELKPFADAIRERDFTTERMTYVRLYNSDVVRYAFLKSIGSKTEPRYKNITTSGFGSDHPDVRAFFAADASASLTGEKFAAILRKAISEKTWAEIEESRSRNPLQWTDEGVKQEFVRRLGTRIDAIFGSASTLDDRSARIYAKDRLDLANGLKIYDRAASARSLSAAIGRRQEAFGKYVESLASRIPTTSVVRVGNSDLPYTTENIVKAMEFQGVVGTESPGIGNVGIARAFGARRFGSVAEIVQARGQLAEEASFEEHVVRMEKRIRTMAAEIGKAGVPSSEASTYRMLARFFETDGSEQSASRVLEVAYRKVMPESVVREFMSVAEQLRSMPAEYFEAKPMRPVGFGEFVAAVVPEKTGEHIISGLRRAGVPEILTYKDQADRIAKIQSFRSVMFRLSGEAT